MCSTAHVVGDEEVRQAELALELAQQVQHLRLDGHVQRRDGLVADDELGPQRQRAGDADALPLAAGELVRVAPGVSGHQPTRSIIRRTLTRRSAALPCRGSSGPRRCSRPPACAGRAAYGSWKMICMSRPVQLAGCGFEDVSLRHRTDRPDVGSIRRSRRRPTVVLPQPDSPTRPSVSPRLMLKLTSSTACTQPAVRCSRPAANRKMIYEVAALDQACGPLVSAHEWSPLRCSRPTGPGVGVRGCCDTASSAPCDRARPAAARAARRCRWPGCAAPAPGSAAQTGSPPAG